MRPPGVPGPEPTRPNVLRQYSDLTARLATAKDHGAPPAQWRLLREECLLIADRLDDEGEIKRKSQCQTAREYELRAKALRHEAGFCRAAEKAARKGGRAA